MYKLYNTHIALFLALLYKEEWQYMYIIINLLLSLVVLLIYILCCCKVMLVLLKKLFETDNARTRTYLKHYRLLAYNITYQLWHLSFLHH